MWSSLRVKAEHQYIGFRVPRISHDVISELGVVLLSDESVIFSGRKRSFAGSRSESDHDRDELAGILPAQQNPGRAVLGLAGAEERPPLSEVKSSGNRGGEVALTRTSKVNSSHSGQLAVPRPTSKPIRKYPRSQCSPLSNNPLLTDSTA